MGSLKALTFLLVLAVTLAQPTDDLVANPPVLILLT